MILRISALLALVLACTATSCIKDTGIAIAVGPTLDSASTATSAFALIERVTAMRGMQPYANPHEPEEAWIKCFVQAFNDHGKLILCGTLRDREVQVRLREVVPARRSSPYADSLRGELLDSLRAEFGERAVRECEWRTGRRSGCPSPAQRANAKPEPADRTTRILAEPKSTRISQES